MATIQNANISEDMKNAIAYLSTRTAYDELVIGCFLCNYGNPNTCGGFRNTGCKNAARCKRLDIVTNEAVLNKLRENAKEELEQCQVK